MICPQCRSTNDDGAQACFGCGHALISLATIRKGTVLAERYEVQSTLGKGGMGMVFKAHDRVLDETVALKIMRSEAAENADMARRFRQEIKLARKVRHRNVCGIHEYGEVGGLRFIAMEYIEGVDLRHILRQQGPPPLEEAFEIAVQVCEGLQAIHDAGIIHRDLKTPNIMRDGKGFVRLMDFGIAKQFGESTLSGTALGVIMGTPEYMSPEQGRGEKIDFRSDIYALGIVIFEVFTGDVPFRGDTPLATIFKHLEQPPALVGPNGPVVPESLVSVLARALAKDPAQRHGSPLELADAIAAARDATIGPPTSTSGSRRMGAFTPSGGVPATRLAALPSEVPVPQTPRPTPVPTAVPTHAPTSILPPSTLLPTMVAEEGEGGQEPARRSDAPRTRPPAAAARRAPTLTPEGARRGPGPRVLAYGAAAVVALGLLAGVVVWRMRSDATAVAPAAETAPASEPSVAAGVETGVLVVDATPWGEVVKVVDQNGNETPVAGRFTPVVLVLPPGQYTVSVTNPEAGPPVTVPATVEAGRSRTVRAEFQHIDVADYFRVTGW